RRNAGKDASGRRLCRMRWVLPIQLLVEVFPLRVGLVDQRKLPHARPMLQVLLALQSVAYVIVWFVVHKAFQTVALAEAVDNAFAMFPNAAREVARHPNVECAIAFV